MRKCPKCGSTYADIDIRSMCSSCMTTLVTVADEPEDASTAMPAPGPMTVGASPASAAEAMTVVTIDPPVAQIPEVPIPQVPDIPAPPDTQPPFTPAPEPGPIQPPVTPLPDPDLPQPPLIPTPQPQPQPVPVPAPTPPRPAEPSSADTGAKPHAVNPHVEAQAKQSAGGYWIAAFLLGMLALPGLFTALLGHANFAYLMFTACMVGLVAYLIRQALYRQTIAYVNLKRPERPCLGTGLPLEVVIGVLRTVPIDSLSLTVIGEERAVSNNGRFNSSFRHQFYSRTLTIPPAAVWYGGQEQTLAGEVQIPAEAIPSFTANNNFVEWAVAVNAHIPGITPDINLRLPFMLPPVRVNANPPPITTHRYTLPEFSVLDADIAFDCAVGEGGALLFPAGKQLPFRLTITPHEASTRQQLWVHLVYDVTGSGDHGVTTVLRVACFPHGWSAGTRQEFAGVLNIPDNVPITFSGRHISVKWIVSVRYESFALRECRHSIPVRVIPANVPE